MLFTYTAEAGPQVGRTLYFPHVQGDYKPTGHLNRQGDALIDITNAMGSVVASGSDQVWRSYAEIPVVFPVSPAFLSSYPSGSYFAGLTDDTAAVLNFYIDFMQICVQGGQGTLTDILPPGVRNGVNGTIWSYLKAPAIVNGDYTPARKGGGVYGELTVTFVIPSSEWTASDGTTIPIF